MKYKIEKVGCYREIIYDSESPKDSEKIRRIRSSNRKAVIVFASGCFDIVHSGHSIFTEQLRTMGEKYASDVIVVIGVGRDETIRSLKSKDRPINPERNRAYLMASLKAVDYVILNNKKVNEGKIDFRETLSLLQPDIFVINSDDSGIEKKRALCKELGIKFGIVKRNLPGFLTPTSSTAIIEKIKT